MKTKFLFASKASKIYNIVSSQHILPCLNMLPQLSLLSQATNDKILVKIEELHNLRCRVCCETGDLTQKLSLSWRSLKVAFKLTAL